jgi:hypothetical protein
MQDLATIPQSRVATPQRANSNYESVAPDLLPIPCTLRLTEIDELAY